MGLRFQLSGFAWQGGEPTLMGLDFYKRAVELQKKYGVTGQEVGNSLQTNALLLDDADWCRFLHENKFLVGISIDGPKELHDHYRLDLGGHGTWDRVMRAIDLLQGAPGRVQYAHAGQPSDRRPSRRESSTS